MLRSLVGRQICWVLAAFVVVWVALQGGVARAESPRGAGAASYRVVAHTSPGVLCPGETREVDLTLENTGLRAWSPELRDRLSYHWKDIEGVVVVRDGRRTDLAHDVEPGDRVTVTAKVTAPKQSGRHVLVWRMLQEGTAWFPESEGASAAIEIAGEGPALAWSIEPFEVPEVVARGETSIDVTVTNRGCATWSNETGDRLSYRWFAPDGTTKRGEGPRTAFEHSVAPGDRAHVRLKVRGPSKPGRHLLRIAPIRERVAWHGAPLTGVSDALVDARTTALQWAWLSAELPSDLAAGDLVEIPVEIRNTGTEAWDPERGDRLSYHWVRDGVRLRREGRRTLLPRRVEPGDSLRVPVTVVAPDEAGAVQLAIEPLRERVTWFGAPMNSVFDDGGPTIDVAPPPYVWTRLGVRTPKLPLAGRDTSFVLVVRNDGSRVWDPAKGDRASYFVLAPDGSRISRGRRTPLPRRIAPGEVVQLEVSFDTPSRAGEVLVAFGIVREHVRWFETSAKPVPLRIVRRSSVWLILGGLGLGLWWVAFRRGHRWAAVAAWPLWTAGCVAVLSETFGDVALLQLYARGTSVALSVAALFGFIVSLVPPRARATVGLLIVGILSLVAWVDLAYAAFFGSLAPLTAVAALHHLVDAKATVGSTIRAEHGWLLLPLLSGIFVHRTLRDHETPARQWRRVGVSVVMALLSVHAIVALGKATTGTLAVRIFSEAHNARRFGYVGAHLFQAVRLIRDWSAPPLSERDRMQAFAQLRAIADARTDQFRGVAEGSNLVILQVEALQQWVVDAEVDGRPVMPFLSGAHTSALAYDHVYDQTLQGRTSDAEYLVLGSGHALPEGALSFLRADNEFRTIVHALRDVGYSSYSAHPYERGFWNRSVLHPAYGFSQSDFQSELGRGPKSGWGLADGPFLERFDERLVALPEPFVAFGVTLSLHHPYDSFPKSLAELDVGALQGTWVGNYLQAMHHFDRSLQAWLERMRARGVLQRTVVVIYGDHVTGMELDDDVVALAEVSDDRHAQMRMHRVPAYIWLPSGEPSGPRSMVGGQIDLGVTALHFLGVEPPVSAVGTPLVGDGPGFAALPTGGVAGPEHMLVRRGVGVGAQGVCINPRASGEQPRNECAALEARGLEQLELARTVLDHDLYVEAERSR